MPYLIYFVVINFVAAIMCIYDKRQARKDGWRVSEKALFAVSIAGGALGMYITMRIIRHKTKHWRFMIGLPIIISMHTILCYIFIDSGAYLL